MRTAAIILCGGRSTRMGAPKAWLRVNGETLLARIAKALSVVVTDIVVVAAEGQDVPPLPVPAEVIRDPEPGRGPLVGLSAGFARLRGRADVVYASSCDAPLLRAEFAARVLALLGDDEAAVPDAGGYRHPLAAAYRVAAAADAAAVLVSQGRMRPAFLFDALRTRVVSEAELRDVDPALESLRNVNTPEEFAAALREAGGPA